MTKTLFVIACALPMAACNDFARISRMSPLAPTPVVAVATPPTVYPFQYPFQEPFTELSVGSSIQRKVDEAANPECLGVPGFGCQYFRIMPDREGMLDVEVKWVPETQPNQGLDLSIESSASGQVWANISGVARTLLSTRVKAGETSQITVWYTFPGLEFSLQAVLRPN